MSSKGRGADGYKADPLGFFQTQPQVTRAALSYLGIKPGMRILEPGCGAGAIGKVLREEYGPAIEIVGVEIDKKRAKKAQAATVAWGKLGSQRQLPVFDDVLQADFLQVSVARKFDLSLTNPSFAIWLPVAMQSFGLAPRTTLLVPWNSAASKKRATWWSDHPAYLRLLSRRPSFAISVKCEAANGKRARDLGVKLCDYQVLIALDAKPKKLCPKCGLKTTTTHSDSNEYCWANWGPDIEFNRWDPLETPEEPEEL